MVLLGIGDTGWFPCLLKLKPRICTVVLGLHSKFCFPDFTALFVRLLFFFILIHSDNYAQHVDMAGVHATLNGHILHNLVGHTGVAPAQPQLLAVSNVENWEQSPNVRSMRKTGGSASPQMKSTAI